jgi:hypothetical protein
MQDLYKLDRNTLQTILESDLGMQVYDTQTDDELREALALSLDDEVLAGVVCRAEEVDECKARFFYKKIKGCDVNDNLEFEGIYPEEGGEPLGLVRRLLEGLMTPELVKSVDASWHWQGLKDDYETLQVEDEIQVWMKVS